jgi:hypothetical protein
LAFKEGSPLPVGKSGKQSRSLNEIPEECEGLPSPVKEPHGYGKESDKSRGKRGSEVDFGFNDKFVKDLGGSSEKSGSDQQIEFQKTDQVVHFPNKPRSGTEKDKGSSRSGLNVDVGNGSDRYFVKVPKTSTLKATRMGN